MTHIVIIGAGISGLTTAWLLSPQFEVTLIEANDYLGGHTHTHNLVIDNVPVKVDTGFIVYNERTYTRFISLLGQLGCQGRQTQMSFSVSDPVANLEYCGHNLNTLFAQRSNLVRPRFYRMLADIVRFNKAARLDCEGDERSLGQYLRDEGYGAAFCNQYILPMAAAIWSTGPEGITNFPVRSLARFFANHGLLDLRNRPKWYVVAGGSSAYVEAMKPRLGQYRVKTPVKQITRFPTHVEITTQGATIKADQVVIATHSDEALALLTDPTSTERDILGSIRYTKNRACLHTDSRTMPARRRAWASWNYRIDERLVQQASLTYNMNILQGLDTEMDLLVTLNDTGTIDENKIIQEMDYSHPLYDNSAVQAQLRHGEISGMNRTHYAGAYWGYGFHEDGVESALRVCRNLGVTC